MLRLLLGWMETLIRTASVWNAESSVVMSRDCRSHVFLVEICRVKLAADFLFFFLFFFGDSGNSFQFSGKFFEILLRFRMFRISILALSEIDLEFRRNMQIKTQRKKETNPNQRNVKERAQMQCRPGRIRIGLQIEAFKTVEWPRERDSKSEKEEQEE